MQTEQKGMAQQPQPMREKHMSVPSQVLQTKIKRVINAMTLITMLKYTKAQFIANFKDTVKLFFFLYFLPD